MRFKELPDTLTIVLGTRGTMPILTRVCMECQADDPKAFDDLAKEELSEKTHVNEDGRAIAERVTNFTVQCKECGHTFVMQVRSFIDPARGGMVLNHVYELTADGSTNYGQLGHFVSIANE